MVELRFSNEAVADLDDIWAYTLLTWSETQAEKYYNQLIAACRLIASNPTVHGRRYPSVGNDVTGYPCGRHVIFYRILEDGAVEITRILHERMDLPNRLKN